VYSRTDQQGVKHYTIDRGGPAYERGALQPAYPSRPLEIRERLPSTSEPGVHSSAPEGILAATPEMLALEERISRDQATIKRLISENREPGISIGSDPELREIATRLPRMQAELAQLRAKQAE